MIKFGKISRSYKYAIDGEYCSGYSEYDAEVTDYWKTGDLKNKPKEVKLLNSTTYYRYTKKNSWRIYCKQTKKYDNSHSYLGGYIQFIPNETANSSNNYNKVNLGSW